MGLRTIKLLRRHECEAAGMKISSLIFEKIVQKSSLKKNGQHNIILILRSIRPYHTSILYPMDVKSACAILKQNIKKLYTQSERYLAAQLRIHSVILKIALGIVS